jgi:hypothetical protein
MGSGHCWVVLKRRKWRHADDRLMQREKSEIKADRNDQAEQIDVSERRPPPSAHEGGEWNLRCAARQTTPFGDIENALLAGIDCQHSQQAERAEQAKQQDMSEVAVRDRMCKRRSSDRAQRRASAADPCEILRLLQWMASSCFAREGCAGRAPDRPIRKHRRPCNLGRIASPIRTNLVFGSDNESHNFYPVGNSVENEIKFTSEVGVCARSLTAILAPPFNRLESLSPCQPASVTRNVRTRPSMRSTSSSTPS